MKKSNLPMGLMDCYGTLIVYNLSQKLIRFRFDKWFDFWYTKFIGICFGFYFSIYSQSKILIQKYEKGNLSGNPFNRFKSIFHNCYHHLTNTK